MAVILAGLASLGLFGNYTYFGVVDKAAAFSDWPLMLACGVLGGALGAGVSWSALKVTRRIRRWNTIHPLSRTLGVAVTCGLVVALIGIGSGGLTFGTGYSEARLAVEGTPLPFFFFIEKLVAGLVSMIAGIPGGLCAVTGGGSWSRKFDRADSQSQCRHRRSAWHGRLFCRRRAGPHDGLCHHSRDDGNHDNVVPLMCVSVLGYGTARMISRELLYHALSRVFVAEAI